jgi:alpha-D-ribose 1-methylphosphonate 5-triphosphate synthase subunit PhnI
MSLAIKGGEKAIENSLKLLAEERRGDPSVPELTVAQIEQQLGLAVERVMTEGSLYDRRLAALALKQAQGDVMEAIFLARAYRATLPRLGVSVPIETDRLAIRRRISAVFKDLPGGQVLGATYDYTHRMLDFDLEDDTSGSIPGAEVADQPAYDAAVSAISVLDCDGLIEGERPDPDAQASDLTREPLAFPARRDQRLQSLVRGDEGFVVCLAYSTARGYGSNHPFVGELRVGEVAVEIVPEDLGFPIQIGEITVTECQMVNQFHGAADAAPQFTRGYGLTFGRSERKALAMAMIDRALRHREFGEIPKHPAQDEEFVLGHCDSIEAVGLISHYKLPHYVDFQAELQLLRGLRTQHDEAAITEAAE